MEIVQFAVLCGPQPLVPVPFPFCCHIVMPSCTRKCLPTTAVPLLSATLLPLAQAVLASTGAVSHLCNDGHCQRLACAWQANKGYQVNHLVQRTTFLYPSLWLNSSSSIDGLWLPTFWTRSRFEPNATSAASLRSGLTVGHLQLPIPNHVASAPVLAWLRASSCRPAGWQGIKAEQGSALRPEPWFYVQLRRAFIVYPVLVVPPVFGFLLAVGVLFLGLTPVMLQPGLRSHALLHCFYAETAQRRSRRSPCDCKLATRTYYYPCPPPAALLNCK